MSVVRPTGCHHHVVDCREVTEELIESNRIRGVEGRGTQGINLTGSVVALGIPAREDHLGQPMLLPGPSPGDFVMHLGPLGEPSHQVDRKLTSYWNR